jgi:hypothetical protein
MDVAIKVFHDKQIKQYMTTKPQLQKILPGILHTENETHKTVRDRQYQTTEEKTRNHRVALIQLHTIKHLNNKTTKCQKSPHTYQY